MMKQVREDIINALESVDGYPVFRQGSLNQDEAYPSSFFTYWIKNADDGMKYDNRVKSYDVGITIYFYTNNPSIMDSTLFEAQKALEKKGWLFRGLATDAASDEITHIGIKIDGNLILNANIEN